MTNKERAGQNKFTLHGQYRCTVCKYEPLGCDLFHSRMTLCYVRIWSQMVVVTCLSSFCKLVVYLSSKYYAIGTIGFIYLLIYSAMKTFTNNSFDY